MWKISIGRLIFIVELILCGAHISYDIQEIIKRNLKRIWATSSIKMWARAFYTHYPENNEISFWEMSTLYGRFARYVSANFTKRIEKYQLCRVS